jgi:hypothetical protein
MSALDRQAHWENVYATNDENSVSWFEESPTVFVDLVHATGVDTGASSCLTLISHPNRRAPLVTICLRR